MTHVSGTVWPSISVIRANHVVADASPIVVPGELEEGREEQHGQVRDPVNGDHDLAEAHAEVRPSRVARRPSLPTKGEIEEHHPLHLNYRSWCA